MNIDKMKDKMENKLLDKLDDVDVSEHGEDAERAAEKLRESVEDADYGAAFKHYEDLKEEVNKE